MFSILGHILLTNAISHRQSAMGGIGSIPLSPAVQHFGVFLQCEVAHPQRSKGNRLISLRRVERLVSEPIDRHLWSIPNQSIFQTSLFRTMMIVGVIVVILPFLPPRHHRYSVEAVFYICHTRSLDSPMNVPIAISPNPSTFSPRITRAVLPTPRL